MWQAASLQNTFSEEIKMLRSLYSGMTGVKAQQAQLDVISNNIANVNTTGFKSGRITFADALSETISGARGTAGNIAGANPIQIGRGTLISSVDTNFKQGSIDQTGMRSDIAISGRGFFIATDGQQQFFTRAGGFQILEDGSVMAQGGNFHIMGRLADDSGRFPSTTAINRIVLPFGRKEPARATSNIDIYCNLDKSASKQREILGKDQFMSGNKPATMITDLAMIDGNTIQLGDAIEISGTDRRGNDILDENHKTWTFVYGQDGTTMADFLNKINEVFNSTDPINGATATLDQSGRIRLIANTAGESEFTIMLSVCATNQHATTTEVRAATDSLMRFPNNEIRALNGGAANMDYQAGDTVEIEVNGQPRIFTFVTGRETISDLLNFINSIPGARAEIRQGDNPGEYTLVDTSATPAHEIVFSNSSGTATGLHDLSSGATFTMTGYPAAAIPTDDLRNLMGSSISHGKTIEISGRNPDGKRVSGTFTYGSNQDGTTIQDLLNKISNIFNGITATLGANGQIILTNNAPGNSLSSIEIKSGTSHGFEIGFETEHFTTKRNFTIGDTPVDGTAGINYLDSVRGTPYQHGDIINIFASQMQGETRQISFTFGPRYVGGIRTEYDGETLQELVDTINNSNQIPGLIASINSQGQIVFTDLSLNDDFDYTGVKIVNGNGTVGMGLETTFTTNAGTDNTNIVIPTFTLVEAGETGKHHSAITVFDSSGQAHRIDIHYTQDPTPGSNRWTWSVLVNDGKLVPHSGGSGHVQFNDDGSLRQFAYDNGKDLRFRVPGGEEMRIKLNSGTPGSFEGMTSFHSPSTNVLIEQDGYTMGTLLDINIDDLGIISGIYSNGVSKQLAQLALANFTNEGGLMREGNNLFSANASSGNPILAWAGVNNNTRMRAGHLEASNVDLTEEFSKLIISQRALEANAKVINTADMVLSTIIDRMKR